MCGSVVKTEEIIKPSNTVYVQVRRVPPIRYALSIQKNIYHETLYAELFLLNCKTK